MIDQALGNVIGQYTALLASDSERARNLLLDYSSTFANDPLYLQTLGEAHLENNDVDSAYDVLTRACQLDPQASKGVEKFLHLGQIVGGKQGVDMIEVAIAELIRECQTVAQNEAADDDDNIQILLAAYGSQEEIVSYLLVKLSSAIGAIIEIWMTDLCMEPEAEEQCEKWCSLLNESCSTIAESHSLIASVRISQQKFDDAEHHIAQAWELFQERKTQLESIQADDEYLDLYEPILTLAKYALECGLFELAAEISGVAREINENSIEGAYLEGFANYLEALRLQTNTDPKESWKIAREFEKYQIVLGQEPGVDNIASCQLSLSAATKLLYNPDLASETDPELVQTIAQLLDTVGGFVAREPKIDYSDSTGLDSIE